MVIILKGIEKYFHLNMNSSQILFVQETISEILSSSYTI